MPVASRGVKPEHNALNLAEDLDAVATAPQVRLLPLFFACMHVFSALTQPLSSVCRRLAVAREQAAIKIQAAAKPTNLWPSELLALALLMWSRIAKFRRCQRRGQPPPVYLRYVQQWHEWETKAIQKQLRVEVAQELHGPSLRALPAARRSARS